MASGCGLRRMFRASGPIFNRGSGLARAVCSARWWAPGHVRLSCARAGAGSGFGLQPAVEVAQAPSELRRRWDGIDARRGVESLGARVRDTGSRGFTGTGPNLIQWQPLHLLTQSPLRQSRGRGGTFEKHPPAGASFFDRASGEPFRVAACLVWGGGDG